MDNLYDQYFLDNYRSQKDEKISNLTSIIQKLLTNKSTFLDIGAYLGSFTESLLQSNPHLKGIVFEPTTENFTKLNNKFEHNSNIEVFNLALDYQAGEKEFFIIEDTSQNSLLNFEASNIVYKSTKVNSETLDGFISSHKNISDVDFIKIDTQGLDLRILHGAVDTIDKYKPSILTEFIFIPLYKNQGFYYEQFEFMKKMNYCIAGIYNTHNTENGLLAFADILFIHFSKYSKITNVVNPSSSYYCTDYFYVLEENIRLKSICEERLQLINRVSKEAEERLKVLHTLDKELKRLKGQK